MLRVFILISFFSVNTLADCLDLTGNYASSKKSKQTALTIEQTSCEHLELGLNGESLTFNFDWKLRMISENEKRKAFC